MADSDRGYISQYSQQDLGIGITVASVPTDADGDVTVTILNEDTQALLLTRTAAHTGLGQYSVSLTPDDTAALGNYQATWSYELSGVQKLFQSWFGIGGAEPAYDQLSSDYQAIVDSVWIRMADLFDSPSGGPNLQTWAQTNFNRGRVAQLMRIALGRLNTMLQPTSTYTLDSTSPFPTAQWGALLEQMTWIEVVKHLRRSYAEQPELENGGISRLNRQSYYDRWSEILHDEEANVADQLSIFKIQNMFLGRPSVLVAGGIFGRYSTINRPFMAARPRMYWANAW